MRPIVWNLVQTKTGYPALSLEFPTILLLFSGPQLTFQGKNCQMWTSFLSHCSPICPQSISSCVSASHITTSPHFLFHFLLFCNLPNVWHSGALAWTNIQETGVRETWGIQGGGSGMQLSYPHLPLFNLPTLLCTQGAGSYWAWHDPWVEHLGQSTPLLGWWVM